MYAWEDLMELSGMSIEEAEAWFDARECGGDWDIEDGDGYFHEGGYWSDHHLVVEFEGGHVARWYRFGYWD